ncbi:MAG: ribonuclease D [Planctomycetota bacterium]
MIATQEALDELVAHLATQPALAVDCEMDSLYAYRTSLCVVQLGWDGGEALIDALVDLDRQGLARLFLQPGLVKVFHGGENDVGLLTSKWGMRFESVFDTMAASQVLGHEGVGLAALLDRHFQLQVSKRFQKADWRLRPLPEPQAEYARQDVRHLLELRRRLLADLEALGRVEEAESEFRRISRARLEDKTFDPESWVAVRGARAVPVEKRGVLRELYAARDAIARESDRAPYRVFHESVLVDLTLRPPADEESLRSLPGISRSLSAAAARQLLDAIQRGSLITDLPLPRRAPPDRIGSGPLSPEELALFDAFRAWRQKRAQARGVDVARVATNALLTAIVRARPSSESDLAAVDGMEPWRMREYGVELLGVLRSPRAQRAVNGPSPTDRQGASGT